IGILALRRWSPEGDYFALVVIVAPSRDLAVCVDFEDPGDMERHLRAAKHDRVETLRKDKITDRANCDDLALERHHAGRLAKKLRADRVMADERFFPRVDVIPRIHREVADERFDLGRVPVAFTFRDERFDGSFLFASHDPSSIACPMQRRTYCPLWR